MFRDRLFPMFMPALFATASIALGGLPGAAGAATKAEPEGFTVLHSFSSLVFGPPSGPNSPLVEQRDGSLLGSTEGGGKWGRGTVYQVKPGGGIKTVVAVRPGAMDVVEPMGPPIAVDRTTAIGAIDVRGGCGLIYAQRHDHRRRLLHDFSAPGSVGCSPSMLVQGDDGDLYGVADVNTIGSEEISGEIFKISRDGRFTSLYAIQPTDGSLPRWGITKGHDGNFYGTTTGFGRYHYGGTVFRVTPEGVYTTLADIGGQANSGVIQATDGNLYGSSGYSYIYRVQPDGRIDQWVNVAPLREGPTRDLIQGSDGHLYGATDWSIYRFGLDGQITLIHTLDPATDGRYPGDLMQASDGFIYGSTWAEGPQGGGTLFRFRPGTPAR